MVGCFIPIVQGNHILDLILDLQMAPTTLLYFIFNNKSLDSMSKVT